MEALLDLYAEPPDPARPVVCFDEHGYALRADRRADLPAAPGRVRRVDHSFDHAGSCVVAVAFDRYRAWRHVFVSARRTTTDFAGWLRELVEVHYPEATTIRLVVDNLNTHTPAALYAAFPPELAHRLARKLEFHYTPKHGSWLNMVEIELSVLSRQCLQRRLPTREAVATEGAVWAAARNAANATVEWRFTTNDARHKLSRHYPYPT